MFVDVLLKKRIDREIRLSTGEEGEEKVPTGFHKLTPIYPQSQVRSVREGSLFDNPSPSVFSPVKLKYNLSRCWGTSPAKKSCFLLRRGVKKYFTIRWGGLSPLGTPVQTPPAFYI